VTAPARQIAVVTGACGGIGEAIVRSFASVGAQLAICDLRARDLDHLAAELRAAGGTVHDAVVDVADASQVETFCHTVTERFGRIDCLINTVGIVDNMGDVETLTVEVWERSLAVNLTSAFLMAKHCVTGLKVNGGVIVNLSSISGFANQADGMAYSVTKAGLLSLTKSEAIDLAQYGIRAVAVCPGSVYTPLVDRAVELTAQRLGNTPEHQLRDWESQYPTGRFSRPEEVADLTLFLCSDQARNITGTAVVIDGGITALLPER
jgi:NAD(P)-dependent dehydrogenase (short-subunit alcohol dehydrogenase family)